MKQRVKRFGQQWLAVMALAAVGVAQADTVGSRQLDRFLNEVSTLTAAFTQVQMDEDGAVLAQSSGRLWISRPDRFRWQYDTPYEQLVVCDGQVVWSYDPDLEQATRRPAGEALAGTPAALLSRRADALEGFEVRSIRGEQDRAGVELVPQQADSDFAGIRLWFADGVPTELQFDDQLGGTTQIRLSDARSNARLADAQFSFQPPKGTEVIEAGSPTP